MILLVFVVAVVAVLLYGVGLYNGLVTGRNGYRNAFAQIDVQLTRRYDLIPNLVETVKAYMKHERDTLEAVVQARNSAQAGLAAAKANPGDAAAMQQLAGADNALTQTLARLFALSESYPDLKASQNMMQLSEELSSTENKVAFARQAFNDAVMNYNNAREQFPGSIIANLFTFQAAEQTADPSCQWIPASPPTPNADLPISPQTASRRMLARPAQQHSNAATDLSKRGPSQACDPQDKSPASRKRAIPRRWPGDEAGEITGHAVDAGEHLEEGQPLEQLAESRQPAAQFARFHVMEHVAAHDQVEARLEAQLGQVPEAGEPDVAAAAVTLHHVLARIEPAVIQPRTQPQQGRAPRCLAAAHVEHVAQRSREIVLGQVHHHRDLAGELRARTHRMRGTAVPLVEIGAIVAFGHGCWGSKDVPARRPAGHYGAAHGASANGHRWFQISPSCASV